MKKLASLSHEAGKEAMMFLGDQWIGTEPYKDGFEDLGLDAVVGSIGDGTTTRMIADIPGVKYTEGRFLPYFFPDTFYEGNDPSIEAWDNWRKARRAILRSPIARMGYGGYLSLAAKFPKFVDAVEHISDEFRDIHDRTDGEAARGVLNVAILNSLGQDAFVDGLHGRPRAAEQADVFVLRHSGVAVGHARERAVHQLR